MSLHSKFRFWAFLPIALLLLVTGLLVFVTAKLLERTSMPPLGIFVFLVLFIFVWIWIVFGELRTKVIKIELQDEAVVVSNYVGLGAKRIHNISKFDGFETAILPSKYDKYEYLYLIANGKKVVKLSQFYHSNYAELKNGLTDKVSYLGQKGFSYVQEIKEIFI